MKLLKIFLVFAVFSFACTRNAEPASEINVSSQISQNIDNKVSDKNAPIITVEESGAWCSLCPSYKLDIFSDGTTEFRGEYFVEKEKPKNPQGKYIFTKKQKTSTRKLTEKDFKFLLGKFDEADFFNRADKYIPKTDSNNVYIPDADCPESLSDSSTIHITFLKNDKSKTIHYYRGCKGTETLKKLKNLQESFEKIFKTDDWISKGFVVAGYEVEIESNENKN